MEKKLILLNFENEMVYFHLSKKLRSKCGTLLAINSVWSLRLPLVLTLHFSGYILPTVLVSERNVGTGWADISQHCHQRSGHCASIGWALNGNEVKGAARTAEVLCQERNWSGHNKAIWLGKTLKTHRWELNQNKYTLQVGNLMRPFLKWPIIQSRQPKVRRLFFKRRFMDLFVSLS